MQTMKTVRPETALLQALQDRDRYERNYRSAWKERDAFRKIIATIALCDGEVCSACRGTERDVMGQLDHLSDLEVELELRNNWDSIDASFPDDCPNADVTCFDGWALQMPEEE